MGPTWAERVLLAVVAGTAACFLLFEVYDLDIWFHLAIGRSVLAGEGIPRIDRWTVAGLGRLYHDSHWLFQVLAAAVHGAAGFVGIQVLTALLWGGALAATWAAARRAPLVARALLLFAAAMACSERFLPRPEAVTALMVALFALHLRGRRWSTWQGAAALSALELLWVNAHGLFVIGPALAACTALPGVGAWLRGRGARPVAEARLLGGVTLATLASPHGLEAWRYALLLAGEATGQAGARIVGQVGELAPTLSRETMSAPAFWFFAILAASSVAGVAVGLRRGTVGWDRALQAVLLLGLAMLGRRNMALAAVALPAVVADGLPLDTLLPDGRPRRVLAAAAAGAVIAWGWLAASGVYSERLHWVPSRTGIGVTSSYFPHGLPGFLRTLGIEGPIYASPSLGGFMAFHGFRPLFDGRWEVQDPRILDAITEAPSDPAQFERLVAYYRLPALVLHHEAPDARGLLSWLARGGAWRLMYWDAAASLWLRSEDPRASGHPVPFVALPGRQRLFDRVSVDGFLEAIGDHAARVPNLRAALALGGPMEEQLLRWLASAQRQSGDVAGAEVTTERLVHIDPVDVGGLIDLSVYSLRRGDRAAAEVYLTRALAAEPSNQDALRRLAAIRTQAP